MLCGSHRKYAPDVDLDARETNTAFKLLRCTDKEPAQDRRLQALDLMIRVGNVMCVLASKLRTKLWIANYLFSVNQLIQHESNPQNSRLNTTTY